MRKFLILAAGIVAFTSFAPASYAQGIAVDTPVGGVRIGEPGYHRHYDGGWRERRVYRDRDVRLGGGCRTVTVSRDDGSFKRIRRCD
ncbi:MAG: hypothetical protein WDO17_06640 [Alphaproteobacteria bacterium]